MRTNSPEWEEYCQKSAAMRKRGVQVGDILICDEGARPTPHQYTGKQHVRIMEYARIDGTGPRFFILNFRNGLVAYFDCETEIIQPGTKFRVIKKFAGSVVLQQVENHNV